MLTNTRSTHSFIHSAFATRSVFSLFNFITRGDQDMDITRTVYALITLLLFAPAVALAQPKISVSMKAEKEVVEVINGKQVTKRIPAQTADPGQRLIFTLQYKNDGNEKATNVKVDNPIPENTVYIVGSGIGKNSKMLFSIDGGKNYKQPSLLTYEETLPDGKRIKKQASPEQYTHVRWVISEVPPGKEGTVGFQVKMK
ncbi:MAG: hypothetical protein AMJ55_11060 [Gammaproteobacteria bacterium SG8_15]|nr:MAG: hypothetical protein AMJ55_11060 [Gammaproteobacteria bacterium SG8_15]